jgi:predicted metal-binding protein
MQDAARNHAQVSQKIQAAVVPLVGQNCFHLSCGGCNLCESCAKKEDKPCRFPDKALIPMEGAGVDVYNTTKDTPLKYINGQNTVTYFGMVLFEEKKDV